MTWVAIEDWDDIPSGEHKWIRDPQHRGEGLTCRYCGLTEAEAEALPRTAASCWPVERG
jgi:hypothetical protein